MIPHFLKRLAVVCSLPAVKNRLGISGAVDQRDFVEHDGGNDFGIYSVALSDATAYGKAPIDLIFYFGYGDRVDYVRNDPRRAVLADLSFEGSARRG